MYNLIDCLTKEDKKTIEDYILFYENVDSNLGLDLNKTLKYWNKNKQKMFKVLGKKLKVKVPISLKEDSVVFRSKLVDLYSPNLKANQNHPFVKALNDYVTKIEAKFDCGCPFSYGFKQLLSYTNIETGKLVSDENLSFTMPGKKTLFIQKETKIIKAIQKVLNFIEFPEMEKFEQWRNEISNLTTSNGINSNLVFSIHPIDFMTMSHNNSGWSSCMNWGDGCYSNGVLEMMNSNMVIVAYLESSKEFKILSHSISNKNWRCLFYVNKNIILSGKSYPYLSTQLTRKALDELYNIVHKSMKWNYQYKNQKYTDMRDIERSQSMLAMSKVHSVFPEEHKIIIKTLGMYNDLIEDDCYPYYCYRNWVSKTLLLNASGPCTCIVCGQPRETMNDVYNDYWIEEDFSGYDSDKFCTKCWNNSCDYCGKKSDVKYKKYLRFYINGYFPCDKHYKYGLQIAEVCPECYEEKYYQLDKQKICNMLKIPGVINCSFFGDGKEFFLAELSKYDSSWDEILVDKDFYNAYDFKSFLPLYIYEKEE